MLLNRDSVLSCLRHSGLKGCLPSAELPQSAQKGGAWRARPALGFSSAAPAALVSDGAAPGNSLGTTRSAMEWHFSGSKRTMRVGGTIGGGQSARITPRYMAATANGPLPTAANPLRLNHVHISQHGINHLQGFLV